LHNLIRAWKQQRACASGQIGAASHAVHKHENTRRGTGRCTREQQSIHAVAAEHARRRARTGAGREGMQPGVREGVMGARGTGGGSWRKVISRAHASVDSRAAQRPRPRSTKRVLLCSADPSRLRAPRSPQRGPSAGHRFERPPPSRQLEERPLASSHVLDRRNATRHAQRAQNRRGPGPEH